MLATVWIDGEPRAPEDAVVSVFDRGFLYGDSVFETLRTYNGRIFALAEHLARLEQSARAVAIHLPVPISQLGLELTTAVQQAGFAESYLRVTITRGQGTRLGLAPSLSQRPLRVVIVQPLAPPATELYTRGIAAVTFRTQRVGDGTDAAGAKLGNYLVSVLAMQAAERAGAQEALLVDREGRVLEGASSNIFGVRGAELVTPPVSLGILPGITRSYLFQLCRELGMPVRERAWLTEDLFAFHEVFICSSIRELVPVVSVDGRQIGAGMPGPIFQRLLSAFRARAAASTL